MIKSFSELGPYRIEFDESLKHDPTVDRDSKVWYEQIPIRGKGYIYLKTTTGCAAYVPSMGIFNNMVKPLEDAQVPHQVDRLDDEGVIYFSLQDFKAAAKILGVKMKRPKPKPEVMEKGIEALKNYRLTNVQSDLEGQI
jgi:hypothetical protein